MPYNRFCPGAACKRKRPSRRRNYLAQLWRRLVARVLSIVTR
jgi:hypothetical protein